MSVVLPVYNAADCLAGALDSVFAQSLQPDEIIIVDDCSTDGSYDIALALRSTSPIPLHVLRTPRNSGGPAAPLNAALNAARGELISPDHLETLAPLLEVHPNAFGRCKMVGGIDPTVARIQSREIMCMLRQRSKNEGNHFLIPRDLALLTLVLHGNVVDRLPWFCVPEGDVETQRGI